MKLIAQWLVKALILLLTTYFVPGFRVDSFTTALIAVFILSLLNIFIKPLLLFLTLPINILSLGLFTFIVNAILLYIVSAIVPGFRFDSFTTAVVAALVMTILSTLFSLVFKV